MAARGRRSPPELARFAHRLHVDPRVMGEVAVRAPWELAERAWMHLSRLPASLLAAWAERAEGHVVIGVEPARYEPGLVMWRDMRSRGVIFVHARHVLVPSPEFWRPVGEWLDHWLGSGAMPGGQRLSDGAWPAGAPAPLAEAARRWQRLMELGYLADWLGTEDAHELFAVALAWMMVDRRRLSVADPQAAKWFRGTVLNDGFWRQVIPALRR